MPKFDRNILIQNIDLLIKKAGINKSKLASDLGMSQPNVSKALNPKEKKCFTLEQVIDIADYFDVTIDSLVGSPKTDTIVSADSSRDIAAFLRGEDIVEERYSVDTEERRREYVMLGLRLGKGISDSEYRARCGRGLLEDMPQIEKFVSAGYLVKSGERIAFSDKGFFVSNAILSELLN